MSSVRSGVVALVTGAASGIGAATARLIAPTCRHLVLHGRASTEESRTRLAATAETCSAFGADVTTLTGDLAEPDAGRKLVEQTIARCGGLDHLVSNAGFADKRSVAELGRKDVDRSYAAMTGAFFELAQAAMPALKASDHGRVVLVSSFVAHRFARGGLFPASAAAKAGAEALARSLAAELAPRRDGECRCSGLYAQGFGHDGALRRRMGEGCRDHAAGAHRRSSRRRGAHRVSALAGRAPHHGPDDCGRRGTVAGVTGAYTGGHINTHHRRKGLHEGYRGDVAPGRDAR